MAYIGNDIIDLNENANVRSFSNEKYLRKILTPIEMDYVINPSALPQLPYIYWACKECAYKIAMKSGYREIFAPQRFSVSIHESTSIPPYHFNLSVLSSIGSEVFVKSEITSEYVLAWASDSKAALENIVYSASKTTEDTLSSVMKSHLAKSLAFTYNRNESDIFITKSKEGIPYVEIKNLVSVPDISFSHDGMFYSYAYLKN